MAPFFSTSAPKEAPQAVTYSCVSCRREFSVANSATFQGCPCGSTNLEVVQMVGAAYPQTGTEDKAPEG